MQIELLFNQIREKAYGDSEFRTDILSAYDSDRPIVNVCKVCQNAGIEIYPMDIADADESAYAAMRRSTNGGGENSPHLIWEEGNFESLINDIRKKG